MSCTDLSSSVRVVPPRKRLARWFRSQRVRDAWGCLALANLCFLPSWNSLLDPYYLYFRTAPPRPLSWLALVFDVCVTAVLFFLALQLFRRCASRAMRVLGYAVLYGLVLHVGNNLLWIVQPVLPGGPDSDTVMTLQLSFAALLALGLLVTPGTVARWFARGVFLLSPLVPILFVEAAISSLWPNRAPYHDHPLLDPASTIGRMPPRLVLVVFDEMSQQLLFEQRPPGIVLPEFDRLRGEAVYASQARSPAQWTTAAIPSLLSGRTAVDARPMSPSRLSVNFGQGYTPDWVTAPNLFTQARQLGYTIAVAGFYHPYCRLFPFPLDFCYRAAFTVPEIFPVGPLDAAFDTLTAMHLRSLLYTLPLSSQLRLSNLAFTDEQLRRDRASTIVEVQKLIQQATVAASDPSYRLVFLHLPVPHPPGIYDRYRDQFSTDTRANYFDNYRLADRTLGMLRTSMERAGLWDSSAVLVLSDHSWRPWLWRQFSLSSEETEAWASRVDDRVPFLLKLPAQSRGITYNRPVSIVCASDLLLAIAQGELRTPLQVVAWLDTHRSP